MAGGSLAERRGSYQSAVSLRSHPTRAEFTQDMRRCTRRGSRTKALVFPIPTTIAVRDGSWVPARAQENMVLCLGSYAGKARRAVRRQAEGPGAGHGREARLIYTYPYDAKLLD